MLIVFEVGYTPDLLDQKQECSMFGSELFLMQFAAKLKELKHDVVIFGPSQQQGCYKGVMFANFAMLESFQTKYSVDVLIIHRYLNFFVRHQAKAKRVILMNHDMCCNSYYYGGSFPDCGKFLVANADSAFDTVVCLTPWHKDFILCNYPSLKESKVVVIGHALSDEVLKKAATTTKEKVPNSFLYVSDSQRGLRLLLEAFPRIRMRLPDATLTICRELPPDLKAELEPNSHYIKLVGKLSYDQVCDLWQTHDVWLYPTQFCETFCLAAIEAQIFKCVCICTMTAALSSTVGDRGVCLDEKLLVNDKAKFIEDMVRKVVQIQSNPEEKKKLIDKGYKWACEQNWLNKIDDEWSKVFTPRN